MAPRRRTTRKKATLKQKISIGATVSTVSGIVALFFVFFPGLRPGTGGCSGTSGTLGALRAEPGQTWGDYADRLNIPLAGQTDKDLKRPGTIVSYRASLHGYKSSHLQIYWSVHRVSSTRPVPGDLKNQLAFDVTPTSCDAEVGQPIFVPRVPGRGKIYVELRLAEVQGSELDSQNTPPFPAGS